MIEKIIEEISAYIDLGGIKYPLIELSKDGFESISKQLEGIKGIPRYIFIDIDNNNTSYKLFPEPLKELDYKIVVNKKR